MVTLAGTQNLSEFELHARAILGLPIPKITLERAGVSAVILANKSATEYAFEGISTFWLTYYLKLIIFPLLGLINKSSIESLCLYIFSYLLRF
jgi:formate-dependent phosphoribosylglycinamide formyltransferase (GAR transformylase)